MIFCSFFNAGASGPSPSAAFYSSTYSYLLKNIEMKSYLLQPYCLKKLKNTVYRIFCRKRIWIFLYRLIQSTFITRENCYKSTQRKHVKWTTNYFKILLLFYCKRKRISKNITTTNVNELIFWMRNILYRIIIGIIIINTFPNK